MHTAILLFSCKKKNPEPETPKTTFLLHHSGIADSASFEMDQTTQDTTILRIIQTDGLMAKYYDMTVWISGKRVGDSVVSGEKRVELHLDFTANYDYSELDQTCYCLPAMTSTKLASVINNSETWNTSDDKSIAAAIFDGENFGAGGYEIVNPQIHAEPLGIFIKIHGTVDSLKMGQPNNPKWITNFQFDYTFPVNP